MNDKQIEGVMKSVKQLKKKGATAIKVELEAQMNRRNAESEREYCDHCDEGTVQCSECEGSDRMTCTDCNGNGQVPETDEPNAEMITCGECNGEGDAYCEHCDDGYVTCPDCDGSYFWDSEDTSNWADCGVCLDWLLDKIAEKTGTARLVQDTDYDDRDESSVHNPFSWIKYAMFYYDGSVDSELTFTVPIDNEENVRHLPKVLEAFRELGDEIGEGFNVSGAGMHIALLFSEDASYPSEQDDYAGLNNEEAVELNPGIPMTYSPSNRLPERRLIHFKRAVTQLLPALFFLGTSNENSRALRYRMPRVSVSAQTDRFDGGGSPKYSAISYRYGALEFRVFDTCYDRPTTIFDNIVVIANCMQYMRDEYKSPGLEKIVSNITFGSDVNNRLDRFYCTTTHIDVLNAGLAKLKPSYYTITEVKRQRKFDRTKRKVANLRKETEQQAKVAYREYAERFNWNLRTAEMRIRANLIDQEVNRRREQGLSGFTPDIAEQLIQAELSREMTRQRSSQQREDNFINQQIQTFEQNISGRFILRFN